jgi:[ribosomal protein S5]-alanine N-acetyltransferase
MLALCGLGLSIEPLEIRSRCSVTRPGSPESALVGIPLACVDVGQVVMVVPSRSVQRRVTSKSLGEAVLRQDHARHYRRPMELSSDLVRLRGLREGDLDAVWRYTSDPTVTRYTGWPPQTPDEARGYFFKALKVEPTSHYLPFVITTRNSNAMIGMIDLDVKDPRNERAEVGYGLLPEYWGRGYATDALRCIASYALAREDLFRIEATCHPDNARSASVLQRAGFHYEGRMRGHLLTRGTRRDSLLYARLKTDD